jgi:hypothetical protein
MKTEELVTAVLAAGASALQQGNRNAAIVSAYISLKNTISSWAPNEIAILESDPQSKGRRLVLTEAIQRFPKAEQKVLNTLATTLAARLRESSLPTGLDHTTYWYTRLTAFVILLGFFLAFGWVIDHLLSEEERQYLRELQEEALVTTYALTPWEVVLTFYHIFQETPWVGRDVPTLTPAQFEECKNPARAPYPFRGKECLEKCYSADLFRPSEYGKGDLRNITPLNKCRLGCTVRGTVLFRGDPLVDCLSQCDASPGAGSDYRTDACFVMCGKQLESICASDETRYYYANVSVLEAIGGRSVRSFASTIRATYFSSPVSTAIFFLQLALGILIVIAAIRFLSRLEWTDEWEELLGAGMIVWVVMLAYLLWLAVWIGINVFGVILSAGGIVAYICTYYAGLKFIIEKGLDIQIHGPAERLAHAIVSRIFQR